MKKFFAIVILISFLLLSGCSFSKYTVTFNTLGGSLIDSQKVASGEKAVKPVNPTKNGFDFVNWQLDGKDFDFNNKIDGDIILDAVWKSDGTKVSYTVTFDIDGSKREVEIDVGGCAPEPTSIPSKTGYTFVGWRLEDSDENFDFDTILTSDVELIAKFISNSEIEESSNDNRTTIYVTSIDVQTENTTIEVGETTQLDVTYSPVSATNKGVEYTSSNKKIATVSTSGLVKGVREGTVTIEVVTTDGGLITKKIEINVVKGD